MFSYLTLPNTYVNNYDQSFQPRQTVLAENWKDFDIVANGRNGKTVSFNTKDINYEETVSENASLDQNPFLWPKAFFEEDEFEIDYKTSFNNKKLDQIIEKSSLMNDVSEPVDAKIFMGKNGKYVIKKESEGDLPDHKNLKATLIDAISNRQDEIKLEKDDYVKPEIRHNNKALNLALNKANEISDLSIQYKLGDYKSYNLTGTELMSLFDWTGTDFNLNYEKVQAYFQKMAEETDTYGTSRTFQTTGLGQVQVDPGVYGWKIDVEESVKKFYTLVENKESGEFEPEYLYRGIYRDAKNYDIGDTYIEIDISRQEMWVYKNGELIMDTPVVTGNFGMGSPTNKGVGKIVDKTTNKTLKGTGFDGHEYAVPVAYWMPIGWDDEGIHDTNYRGAYGGDIYSYNGSNGCINTPPSNVGVIYQNMEVGTPVIVYESSTSNSPIMTY